MTEINIVASFVLIPLFFMLPVIAKYIDMKIATIQAARYQAWEYTVWYTSNSERTAGFSAASAPVKSLDTTAREAERRFFGLENQPLSAADSGGIGSEAEVKQYWRDHADRSLFQYQNNLNSPSMTTTDSTPTLPVLGDITNLLYKGFDAITSVLASVMKVIGSPVGFTVIELDRYANGSMSLQITDNGIINDNGTPITGTLTASAAVLTEPWNAGGVDHVSNQVRGLVPTGIIGEIWTKFTNLPGIKQLWSILTFFLPEFSNDCLKWGYVEPDNVPPYYLESGGSHSCSSGLCQFSPEPTPPPGNCSAF